MNAPPLTALDALLRRAVTSRVTPGAVVEAGSSRGAVWQAAVGRHTYADDAASVDLDAVYDLASLTKVIATTTLGLIAHASGALPFDTRVASRRPAYARRPAFTVADLLEHAAGFPAHRPLYQEVAGRAGYERRIADEPFVYAPRTQHAYTDLGILLLGTLLEEAAAAPLDGQFAAFLAATMPGADLRFGVTAAWRGRVVPTGMCPWRGRVMHGHVHDANAAAIGGVAAHAGLFGTAPAIGQFARWLLAARRGDAVEVRGLTPAIIVRATSVGRVPGSSRALGWDTMLPTSSCGTRLSTRAFGHTGFTGTSLWIDPDRDLYVVLLTNRVHASDDLEGIRWLRVAVHDTIADAWDAR